ncbi:Replication termination factor 2 [Tilletia horrida]|uniref:Replication termination factor 2 n=1 Tax=Tilletia horrida TaxID=155126 RepID=A0AAN6GKW7_9BASI|nr:Replication termination factor 2 [Tilletia horrida]KAK0546477.1 Replication termination factor 2 [Tilletia horrida]KAK0562254.1 Replication termination factor 2 [Tilletia horrida]
MGADGGSIPRRDELVKTRARGDAGEDPALVLRALWTLCALSREPLSKPIVSDATGRMYNKEAVVKFLLSRATKDADEVDPVEEAVAGHLKGLKDVRELSLEPNPALRRRNSPTSSAESGPSSAKEDSSTPFPFRCALTQKELNGKSRFVYLRTCGDVLAETGLRTVASASSTGDSSKAGDAASKLKLYDCPICSKPFRASPSFFSNKNGAASQTPEKPADKGMAPAAEVQTALSIYDPDGDIVPLNPPPLEQEALRAAFIARRAANSAGSKKRKAAASEAAATKGEGGEKKRRKETSGEDAKGKDVIDASDVAAKRAAAAARSGRLNAAREISRAAEAAKDKKEVSPAIRAIYGMDKPKDPKGESWMVRGTFNRYA